MTSKRIVMELPLLPMTIFSDRLVRPARKADREALAALLYGAFRGTVDDEGETFADACAEIDKTFAGTYGRFLWECSFVAPDQEGLAAACLVTWFEPHQAPLVAFSMTRPSMQRRGLASLLLARSINALMDRGDVSLTLVVTPENSAAMSLYRKIGFRPMPEEMPNQSGIQTVQGSA